MIQTMNQTMKKTISSSILAMFAFAFFFAPLTLSAAFTTTDVVRGSVEEIELSAAFRLGEKQLKRLTRHDEIQKAETIRGDYVTRIYYKKTSRGKLKSLGTATVFIDGSAIHWYKKSRLDHTSFIRTPTGEYIVERTYNKSKLTIPAGITKFDQVNPLHRAQLITSVVDVLRTKRARRAKGREFTMTAFDAASGLDFTLVGNKLGHVYKFEDGVLQD